jgi:hypothetical protein
MMVKNEKIFKKKTHVLCFFLCCDFVSKVQTYNVDFFLKFKIFFLKVYKKKYMYILMDLLI